MLKVGVDKGGRGERGMLQVGVHKEGRGGAGATAFERPVGDGGAVGGACIRSHVLSTGVFLCFGYGCCCAVVWCVVPWCGVAGRSVT